MNGWTFVDTARTAALDAPSWIDRETRWHGDPIAFERGEW